MTAEQTVQHDFAAAAQVAAQFEDLSEALRSHEHDRSNEHGYVAYACEQVDQAIFDALNCLSSYLGDEGATKLFSAGWANAKREARKVSVPS